MKKRIKTTIMILEMIFICLCLKAEQRTDVVKSTEGYNNSESSVTIVDVDISSDVPVYEYVPKVIIRGKWGSNPGEFGVWETMNEGDRIVYEPTSMAVDSKGNIYILDIVNERIQKFDSEGRYLLSIPVESFSGKRYEVETMVMVDKNNPDVKVGPSDPNRIDIKKKVIAVEPDYKVIGKNIVIDSEDRLYYYLERNEYERYEAGYKEEEKYERFIKGSDYVVYYSTYMVGYRLKKKTGEVWEFKDDKLVRKMKQGEEKISERYVGLKKEEDKIHKKYNISLSLGNKILKMSIKHPEGLKENEKFVIYSYAPYNGEYIFISHSVYTGKYVEVKKGDWTQETILEKTYMVNKEGKIVGIINEIVNLAERMDKAGNCYGFESENDGITVRKYELKRVK